MNTNIMVFFTQLYYPDITTTAIIMTDLVEGLAAYGLDVKVVCTQPAYIKNLDPHPRGIAFGFHGAGITPVPSAGVTGQAQITQVK